MASNEDEHDEEETESETESEEETESDAESETASESDEDEDEDEDADADEGEDEADSESEESEAGSGEHGHEHGHGHGHGDDQVPDALRGMLKDNHELHYFKIWGVLSVLFAISYVGPYIGEAFAMFWITFVTAFVVAVIKAGLVVREFMHLPQEPKFITQLCATALVFMALLFFWVAPDVLNHEGENWVNQAGAAYTSTAHAEADFDVDTAWSESCAGCHGESGAGNGSQGTAIYPRPTNFTSRAYWDGGVDRERLIVATAEGGAAVGGSRYMPAFDHKYGEEEIAALVDRVMSFQPAPAPAPAAPTIPAPEPVVRVPEDVPDPNVALEDGTDLEDVVPVPEGEEAPEGLEGEEVAEAPPVDMAELERQHAAAYIRDQMFD